MGFLDAFRKKRPMEEKQPEARAVAFEEIADLYKNALSATLQKAEGRSRELQSSVTLLFSSLPSSALKTASFEAQDRRYAAVNMAKDTYVTRLKALLGSLPPEGSTYEALVEFHQACAKILEDIKSVSPKQGMILSHVFPKETKAIILHIKQVESGLSSLQKFILSEGKVLELIHVLEKLGKEHKSLLAQRERLKEREKILSNEWAETTQKRERERGRIHSLLEGQEWKERERAKERAAILEKELRDLEDKIQGELIPLERLLRKAKHVEEKEKSLEHFLSDPFHAFMEDNGRKRLHDILSLTGRLDQEGRITLKESERERLATTRESLDSGQLAKLKEAHGLLMKEKRSRSNPLGQQLDAEKGSLEDSLEALATSLGNLQNEAEKLKRDREAVEKEIVLRKREAERIIKENRDETVMIT